MNTQNTHQWQRPHVRSPQPVCSVKRTERSAKACIAGVVTAIWRHHRGSCVFVIFCVHYVCCLAAWASNYPAPSVPRGWNGTIPLLLSFPFLFHQPWEKIALQSSPGKIIFRDRHNLVKTWFLPGCSVFGARTFISTMGKAIMAYTRVALPWWCVLTSKSDV